MRHLLLMLGLILVLTGAKVESVSAHGDLEARIARLTEQLKESPTNSGLLLLERAILRTEHQQWESALADCAASVPLLPENPAPFHIQGQIYAGMHHWTAARTNYDRFLEKHPPSPEVLVERGRVLSHLQLWPAAENDFSTAIHLAATPEPDWLLERAHIQINQGKNEAALAGLNEGMQRLGAIGTLVMAAIDQERRMGRYEAALQRLTLVSPSTLRPEAALVWRGEILEQAGRKEEAGLAFTHALEAISQLPEQRRHAFWAEEAEAKAKSSLLRLKAGELSKNGPP